MSNSPDDKLPKTTDLSTLAWLFLRLGATAFGGPAAHIAMMQNEVVRKRRWMTEQEFLDLISACNLIPGPNSTEMAIHIGHRQAGWPGLLVAGISFILPAATIVLAVAWAYVQYSTVPAVSHVMNGIKPIVIAIILQALISLSRAALKTTSVRALCFAVLLGCFFFDNELVLLLTGGAASLVWASRARQAPIGAPAHIIAVLGGLLFLAFLAFFIGGSHDQFAGSQTESFSLEKLFWYFAKIGSVLYGSGYVLLAFLRSDLVEQWHWLSASQLLDATAVGQVTPGPVFTTATFIGYLLGGLPGAFLATLGIFLPAFVFVAITGPFIQKLRESKIAGATLDGINSASLALMAFVTIQLARDSLTQPIFIVEALVGAFVLWKLNINRTWLIVLGSVVGLIAGS